MEDFELVVKKKTDDELLDIYVNAHDYQPVFVNLVENELANRNIPTNQIQKVRKKACEINNKEVEQKEKNKPIWGGLFFVTAIVMFLGGIILGSMIYVITVGCIYVYSKKENSDGKVVFIYSEQKRKNGKWMIIVGGVVLFIYLFVVLGAYIKQQGISF